MPFQFVYICDLLEDLERIVTRDPPLLSKEVEKQQSSTILNWFKSHRRRLDAFNTDSDAVLSTLLPQRTTDRCYGLSIKELKRILARILSLSQKQLAQLKNWQCQSSGGDLALFVYQILDDDPTIRSRKNLVTVEEIDHSLLCIASHNAQSSAEIRSRATSGATCDLIGILASLYHQLHPRESKWLTRLIQKDFVTVKFPKSITYSPAHSLLPNIFPVKAIFPTPNFETRLAVPVDAPISVASRSALPSLFTTPVSNISNSCSAPVALITEQTASNTIGVSAAEPDVIQTYDSRQDLSSPGQIIGRATPRKHVRTAHPCNLLGEHCSIANCIFVLSPCVATSCHLVSTILSSHGSRYSDNPLLLTDALVPRVCPITNKMTRKLVLVEPSNKRDAVEFIRQISSMGLRRPSGKKEWVEVYDWRLLETISAIERGEKIEYDPWRRSWIVAV